MRILQICQSYPPMISGAALAAARLAEGLAAEGHDVLVIAASDRREGYSTQNGRLRIERLPSRPNPARVNQRFLLWPQRAINRLIRAFHPDIIHLHEPLLLGMCGIRAARSLNIPVVLTLHSLPKSIAKYTPSFWGCPIQFDWLLWQYGRWFLSQCAAVIAPAKSVADVVRRHAWRTAHIIPNGADLQHYPEQAKRMGLAGREISQQFSHEALIARHAQLYQAICPQPRAYVARYGRSVSVQNENAAEPAGTAVFRAMREEQIGATSRAETG